MLCNRLCFRVHACLITIKKFANKCETQKFTVQSRRENVQTNVTDIKYQQKLE